MFLNEQGMNLLKDFCLCTVISVKRAFPKVVVVGFFFLFFFLILCKSSTLRNTFPHFGIFIMLNETFYYVKTSNNFDIA